MNIFLINVNKVVNNNLFFIVYKIFVLNIVT